MRGAEIIFGYEEEVKKSSRLPKQHGERKVWKGRRKGGRVRREGGKFLLPLHSSMVINFSPAE